MSALAASLTVAFPVAILITALWNMQLSPYLILIFSASSSYPSAAMTASPSLLDVAGVIVHPLSENPVTLPCKSDAAIILSASILPTAFELFPSEEFFELFSSGVFFGLFSSGVFFGLSPSGVFFGLSPSGVSFELFPLEVSFESFSLGASFLSGFVMSFSI